jgi:lipopolysaccharide transport system permease protein
MAGGVKTGQARNAERIVRPVSGWPAFGLARIWRFRELLLFLAWRDIKVRYKQTVLGILWALIQPLTKMVVFTVVFGRIAGIDSGGAPYSVFLFAGLLPWEFFSEAVSRSGNSLVAAADLMKEVPFPRGVLPLAAVAGVLADFVVSMAILAALMVAHGIAPRAELLLVLPLTLALILIAAGVGIVVAALNAIYRDLRYALPFLLQVWLFLTPIVYPASAVPERLRWLVRINPMSGVIDGYRAVILGTPVDGVGLVVSLAVGFAIFLLAWALLARTELYLSDVV